MDTKHDAAGEVAVQKSSGSPTKTMDDEEQRAKSVPSKPPTSLQHAGDTSPKSPDGPEMAKDGRGDSDAETVLLPGVDGYSPSKVRKQIKLEDATSAPEIPEYLEEEVNPGSAPTYARMDDEDVPSRLGKRKRVRRGNGRNDHHNGNSSGLSSVPTSPIDKGASSVAQESESDSGVSRTPSPYIRKHESTKYVDKASPTEKVHGAYSTEGKEHQRPRKQRQRSTGVDAPRYSRKLSRDQTTPQLDIEIRRQTRSRSPSSEDNRRGSSTQATEISTHGSGQRKRRIPPPLRSTRERQSTGNHSEDESSTGESTHPRRSRTRHVATPPTGDSSSAKMAKKRRFQYGLSALAVACEHGDVKKVKQEIQEAPEDLDFPDNAGNTPLQCAALNGFADVCQLLIDSGCNVHCVNHKKDSPLLDAVENGHLEVVEVLLRAGVNPRARNLQGEEPINKVSDEHDDFEAIRDALLAARPISLPHTTSQSSRPPTLHARNSGQGLAANPRTMSHGRSTKTGENQLFLKFDVRSLRIAAGDGDQEAVYRIMDAIGVNGLDDPESLVNAARGGHYDVLTLLLALGEANPDPRPLPHKDAGHATPILAAIGGENLSVIELLLAGAEENRFDPTRKYEGKTYYEIAQDRAGPLWQDEVRILKKAYETYKGPRGSFHGSGSTRTSQKKNGDAEDRHDRHRSKSEYQSAHTSTQRREHKSSNGPEGAPVKRGPGRPRKEGRDNAAGSDAEASSKHRDVRRSEQDSNHGPSDGEPVKPRRKLISGKDLKGERDRRASVASVKSVKPLAEGQDYRGSNGDASTGRTGPRAADPILTSENNSKRVQGRVRDQAGEETQLSRTQSTKRQRSSVSPGIKEPSSPTDTLIPDPAAHKRRRLDADDIRVQDRRSITPQPRLSASPPSVAKEESRSTAVVGSATHDSRNPLGSTADSDDHSVTVLQNHADNLAPENARRQTEPGQEYEHDAQAQLQSLELERKASIGLEIDHEAEEASRRKAEEAEARLLEEQQKTALEEKRLAEECALELEQAEIERLDQEREVALQHSRDAIAKKEREIAIQQEFEDAAKLEQERAAVRKRQEEQEARQAELLRQEELRAQQAAEEERRKLYLEQQRVQREEQERRRAAHVAEQRAERQRLLEEQETARLARLPPLLRWFDGCLEPATGEFATRFRSIQGVRYDTIRPDANGKPEGREQWLVNIQIALLLGEKDLQLSRYTAWDRISASHVAKKTIWKILSEELSMISERPGSPTDGRFSSLRPMSSTASLARNHSWQLFSEMDIFFVKLSDFMFIVPKFPHLRNTEILVRYRELPPDETWVNRVTFPPKWKTDADMDEKLGMCPGTKHFLNGEFIGEEVPKYARTSSSPFSAQRVPRLDGIKEVYPGEPSYERLCIEQGLSHLLNGSNATMQRDGITPPDSNPSVDGHSLPFRKSPTPPLHEELSNGVNGIP